MRILIINSVCGIRSTGRICTDLAQEFTSQGHTVKIAYGRVETVPPQFQKYAVRIGTDWDLKCHGLRTRVLDEHGFGSKHATHKFLQWAQAYDPDLVWLHNIHGYYINVEMLFNWIKSRPNMQVKWTLHDCWAFTGHCTHFSFAGCNQWRNQCQKCPEKKSYPASLLRDNSRQNYMRKKAAFTGVSHMTLITPSQWLAELVKDSYLGEYPIKVQYNTIDTRVFKPSCGEFRRQYGLENMKIILGVASTWNRRKGFYDFLQMAERLGPDQQIVLVGLTNDQRKRLPAKILGLPPTNSPAQLAEIYTAADVFWNPTYEDTYPTVNLEAEACGTCVVSYATGGAPETLHMPESVTVPTGDLCRAEMELRHRLQRCN